MSTVVEGNFPTIRPTTAAQALKSNIELEIDEASTIAHGKLLPIMRDYNIGMRSNLFIIFNVENSQLKGMHAIEFIEMVENKGINIIGLKSDTPTALDAPMVVTDGYIDIGLGPVFYPINETTLGGEAAGIKMTLSILPVAIKGPARVYTCGDKLVAINLVHNTIDETSS